MGIWHRLARVQSQWFSPRRPTILELQQHNHHHSRQPSRHVKRMYLAIILGFVLIVWLQQLFLNNPSVGSVGLSVDDTSAATIIETTKATTIKQTTKSTTYLSSSAQKQIGAESSSSSSLYSKSSNSLLRLDWSNLSPSLELTKRYVAHQSNCSLPLGDFVYRNQYGMGSDLHYWGRGLCNGLGTGQRIRTVGNWTWMDKEACSSSSSSSFSPMLCYFPISELQCPQDKEYVLQHSTYDIEHGLSKPDGNLGNTCKHITKEHGYSIPYQRMAGLEYLFLHMSPLVVQEAERQLKLVFDSNNDSNGKNDNNNNNNNNNNKVIVPKDLITVHIRWGDKRVEMRLVDISGYIRAVKSILQKRGVSPDESVANIYLATEDPNAVKAFQKAMPPSWNLYLDRFYVELLPHRVKGYNGNPEMARKLDGKAGLITLGSLLVAMEANDFVLTTASNWSRMMNELRQSIIDPRCGNCTTMVDLRKAMKGHE